MLRVLDLFSGIGGFSLGLERAGMRTVAFCEIDPYCRAVLAKHWPGVPIHEDIRRLHGADVGDVDIICGGYPCQPFSNAGKRLGTADDRHLWPEYRRLISELRPAWVIGENVAGHVSMGLDDVLSDMDALGYAWRPFVIPACAVDAKHRRDRIWIVAHSGHASGRPNSAQCGIQGAERIFAERGQENDQPGTRREDVAYASGQGFSLAACARLSFVPDQEGTSSWRELGGGTSAPWRAWEAEPNVGRVANGIPSRVDRLRALGNAVVPQIPEIIGRAILEAEAMIAADSHCTDSDGQ